MNGRSHHPLSQATRIAVRFLLVAVVLLAVAWFAVGLTELRPGQQAVIYRFGVAVEQRQSEGLIWTWPRPIEEVEVLPGPDVENEFRFDDLDLIGRESETQVIVAADPRRDGGYVLTADDGIVHMRGSVTWSIDDPLAYATQLRRDGDPAAIRAAVARIWADAVIAAGAERPLGAIMGSGRAAMEVEVLAALVARLEAWRTQGHPLGIAIRSVVLEPALPVTVESVFASAQTARRNADRNLAQRRQEAETLRQRARATAEDIRASARSEAAAIIAAARIAVHEINALAEEADPTEAAWRIYRERIERIIDRAGAVQVVAPDQAVEVRVPGVAP